MACQNDAQAWGSSGRQGDAERLEQGLLQGGKMSQGASAMLQALDGEGLEPSEWWQRTQEKSEENIQDLAMH